MKDFSFMLAPLEDLTGCAFRTICFKYGADLTFSELVRVDALARNNKSSWQRILLKDNTPTVIQLLGAKEDHFIKFLKLFKPSKSFKGFNLNLGCPSLNYINLGLGCAMVRRVSKTKRIVDLLKESGFPVSVKMRLGLNAFDKERKTYLNLINGVDADSFIVHARHGMQSYSEPADFSVYSSCVETGKDIIANGDIYNKDQIKSLKQVGVKGVMIGRHAIMDPSIFNSLKGKVSPSKHDILAEFSRLSESFGEISKYRDNILRFSSAKHLNNIKSDVLL